MKQYFSLEEIAWLESECSQYGAVPVGDMKRLSGEYLELLLSYNRVVSLISRHGDQEKCAIELFLSSLAALEFLPREQGSTCCDVGSGGGFPAIPLAIARPDMRWILIESTNKKCAFLEAVVHGLELKGVQIIQNRFESYSPSPDAQISLIISRAGPRADVLLDWIRGIDGINSAILFCPPAKKDLLQRQAGQFDFYLAEQKIVAPPQGIEDLVIVLLKKR